MLGRDLHVASGVPLGDDRRMQKTKAPLSTREPARPSGPRLTRVDAIRNRELVFAAAKECFAEKGATAGMEEIANRAGVGVGTLYRAFGSRAGLAEAVYKDMVDELAVAANRLNVNTAPWEALVGWLRAYLRQMLAKWAMISVLEPLFDQNPKLLRQSWDSATKSLANVLSPAQHAGLVRRDLEAADLMHLINGVVIGKAPRNRIDLLLEIILSGIRTQ